MIIDKGEKLVQWNKDSLLTNGARTTEHLLQINKSRHRPYTLHKNEHRIYHRYECKIQNYKNSRMITQKKPYGSAFLDITSKI